MRCHSVSIGTVCILLAAGAVAGGVEPWADGRLPVKDGLAVWLDATVQSEARASRGLGGLGDGAAVAAWFDGSGRGRHVLQRTADAQPRFRMSSTSGAKADAAAVAFDGTDDHLAATGLDASLDSATVFLIAAPRSNVGGFRGLAAFNQIARNDYTSGMTIDLGPWATGVFEVLNVEGAGFGGAKDLLNTAHAYRTFHVIAVTITAGKQGVKLFIDGKSAESRERTAVPMRFDELTVGARFYSNSAQPPFTQGFFDGLIAEVVIYDRVLKDDERASVEQYLSAKHAKLGALLEDSVDGRRVVPRGPVADTPPVQMLVPGFAVRKLPVKLTNINNLIYRHDGKLVALGYDGRVWVLSDSDGDGLEDRAEVFWDSGGLRGPIGMALERAPSTAVIVASKGKVSKLIDLDGDGKAEREDVLATGWKEIPQNVDAVGIAVDGEGAVYFGLGTADFSNAYLIDKQTGKAHYDIRSERGTILRIAPDGKSRHIVCTGIRFPVSLAINQRGDLFATDQEGATWLEGGNPLDELVHILPGRHYGFPPRHPVHLPSVVDEPSVYDYGPQHQSTCGMKFNEPFADGSPTFGPSWWSGDALVTGFSRGKLWRTKLVKARGGYIADTQLIAALSMMTVDIAVTPDGGLVASCHSGLPDWGTGPTGEGTLYRIDYVDRDAPQPVLAYAAGPREMRVAFDRPIDPAELSKLTSGVSVTSGRHVRAADRYERLHPPYEVVQRELATARFDTPVHAVSVTADRRTMVLQVDALRADEWHAVALPGIGRGNIPNAPPGALKQDAAIDLACDLSGATATWTTAGDAEQSIWLPHIDLAAARAFTAHSAEHERFFESLNQRGELTLRTRISPPAERTTLVLTASQSVVVRLDGAIMRTQTRKLDDGRYETAVELSAKQPQADVLVEVSLSTGGEGAAPSLDAAYRITDDEHLRALPGARLRLPWATVKQTPQQGEQAEQQAVPTELAGGDWLRGRAVFHSAKALCSRCHRINGVGGQAAPDLGNLVHRDYASVLRDIREPGAVLNPDYLAYTATLRDGRALVGTVQSAGPGKITVYDATGAATTVASDEVATMQPYATSTMPAGLDKAISEQELKDLMTFLLTKPLEPAALVRTDAPAPRDRTQVASALANSPQLSDAPAALRPMRIVLVDGPKDHGPDEHDYPLWQLRWRKLLSLAEGVTVEIARGWPSEAQLKQADVLVFYSANPSWTAERAPELDAYQQRGGGLVLIHYAVGSHNAPEALAERIGLAWKNGLSKFRHGPLELKWTDPGHPIIAGLPAAPQFIDESYWDLIGDASKINLLATSDEAGAARPQMWTYQRGKGRVFVSIPGHYTWTFDDPLFRVILLRGIAWTGGEERIDRFADLAVIGARVR